MKHSVARLQDVERGLPQLDESAACAQAMKAALFEGVKAADMTAIMAKVVEEAKAGDLKAVKLLMEFVSKTAPSQHVSVGVRVNQAGHAPGANGDGAQAAPARLIAGESPRAGLVACARALGKLGPLPAADLAEITGRDEKTVSLDLGGAAGPGAGGLFELQADGRWRLTEPGRRELLPRKGA